jgi:hypothetical protein
MADILLDNQSAPSTPSAGQVILYTDTNALEPAAKNANGQIRGKSFNAAVASQGAGFATDTYVTNSDLVIPSNTPQAKGTLYWRISASKTAAGTATPIYNIRVGAAKTTADTARLTLTGPAQTAIADIGTLHIMVTIRTGGSGTVLAGTAWWNHRGTAANTNDSTGHVEGTGASFDASGTAGHFFGLSINGGTSAAWTITQCVAEYKW